MLDDEKLLDLIGECVLRVLSTHVGKVNAVSRLVLIACLESMGELRSVNFDDRDVRLAINRLRHRGALICSSGGVGGGYWKAAGWVDLDTFLIKELHSRAMDLLEQETAMRRAGTQMFGALTPKDQYKFNF